MPLLTAYLSDVSPRLSLNNLVVPFGPDGLFTEASQAKYGRCLSDQLVLTMNLKAYLHTWLPGNTAVWPCVSEITELSDLRE